MEKMEITLGESDMKTVQSVVQELAASQGSSAEDAARTLLAWGVQHWYQVQAMAERDAQLAQAREQERKRREHGRLVDVSRARDDALEAGINPQKAVLKLLESFSDAELAGTLAQTRTSETVISRLRSREEKLHHIMKLTCTI